MKRNIIDIAEFIEGTDENTAKKLNNKTTTTFIRINCPNCSDDRYQSRGGFSNPGPLVQAMPYCKICIGDKHLIVCYNCNKICRGNFNFCDVPTCLECKCSLECKHVWLANDKTSFNCKFCLKKGPAKPITEECVHKFNLTNNGEICCAKCGCKGKIE